jgi:hypothetical protein
MRKASIPEFLKTKTATAVRTAPVKFVSDNGRAATACDWKKIIERTDLDAVMKDVAPKAKTGKRSEAKAAAGGSTRTSTAQTYSLKQEAASTRTLKYLAGAFAEALNVMMSFYPQIGLIGATAGPLGNFDPESQQAVLSPIGIVNLYREYFFEFDTFLGPAAGHVWVSPGSSLELYEIHTRRRKQERQTEVATEMTTRSETEVSDEDEISSAVSEKKTRDTALGVSASASATPGPQIQREVLRAGGA